MKLFTSVLFVVSLAGWSSIAHGNEGDYVGENYNEIESLIRADVLETLPSWDQSLFLGQFDDSMWSQDFQMYSLEDAIEDSIPPIVSSIAGKTVYRDDNAAMLFDTYAARVAYVSQERKYVYGQPDDSPVSESDAEEIAFDVASTLGIPMREIQGVDIRKLMIAGSGGDGPTPEIIVEKETMVTLLRSVGGLPVRDSFVRVIISNDGRVARLSARWPDFFIEEGIVDCRLEEDTVDDIVSAVYERFGANEISLSQELAYVQVEIGGNRGYIPAIDVLVLPADGAGQGFYVPVVE